MKSRTIPEFIAAVEKLRADPPQESKVWYQTQKEHWLGWLDAYDGPGAYGRTGPIPQDARVVYNRIVCPPMLEWLIRASGTKPDTHRAVVEALSLKGSLNQRAAAIRRLVCWEDVAANLDFRIVPSPDTPKKQSTYAEVKKRKAALEAAKTMNNAMQKENP